MDVADKPKVSFVVLVVEVGILSFAVGAVSVLRTVGG